MLECGYIGTNTQVYWGLHGWLGGANMNSLESSSKVQVLSVRDDKPDIGGRERLSRSDREDGIAFAR